MHMQNLHMGKQGSDHSQLKSTTSQLSVFDLMVTLIDITYYIEVLDYPSSHFL